MSIDLSQENHKRPKKERKKKGKEINYYAEIVIVI